MESDLRQRLRAAYRRCALFPEVARNDDGTFTVRGDAFLAFIELRNLVPEIDGVLFKLEQEG